MYQGLVEFLRSSDPDVVKTMETALLWGNVFYSEEALNLGFGKMFLLWCCTGRCCKDGEAMEPGVTHHFERELEKVVDDPPCMDKWLIDVILAEEKVDPRSEGTFVLVKTLYAKRRPLFVSYPELSEEYTALLSGLGMEADEEGNIHSLELFPYVLNDGHGGFNAQEKHRKFMNKRRQERGEETISQDEFMEMEQGDGSDSLDESSLRCDPDFIAAVKHFQREGSRSKLRVFWSPKKFQNMMKITQYDEYEGVGFQDPEGFFKFREPSQVDK